MAPVANDSTSPPADQAMKESTAQPEQPSVNLPVDIEMPPDTGGSSATEICSKKRHWQQQKYESILGRPNLILHLTLTVRVRAK